MFITRVGEIRQTTIALKMSVRVQIVEFYLEDGFPIVPDDPITEISTQTTPDLVSTSATETENTTISEFVFTSPKLVTKELDNNPYLLLINSFNDTTRALVLNDSTVTINFHQLKAQIPDLTRLRLAENLTPNATRFSGQASKSIIQIEGDVQVRDLTPGTRGRHLKIVIK